MARRVDQDYPPPQRGISYGNTVSKIDLESTRSGGSHHWLHRVSVQS